jgi:hypothetical protein
MSHWTHDPHDPSRARRCDGAFVHDAGFWPTRLWTARLPGGRAIPGPFRSLDVAKLHLDVREPVGRYGCERSEPRGTIQGPLCERSERPGGEHAEEESGSNLTGQKREALGSEPVKESSFRSAASAEAPSVLSRGGPSP